MKAVGMFFIVFGHVVGQPFNQFTQPIYPKQLGVAFFVFITAWSLANDTRPRFRILYNRLFSVYFFGLVFALFLSFLYLFVKNDTNPSNYLPFFLGANVFFNNFPANPTTWYIGTYLHLLLFWAFFLRGKKIRKRHLFYSLAGEILLRSLMIISGKGFVAYMLLPNWCTVFLLGLFWAQKQDEGNSTKLLFLIPAWLGLFAMWAFISNRIGFDTSFPFRSISNAFPFAIVTQSMLISLAYCAHTTLFFAIARCLPSSRIVSFFSRNTLIIFIAHMPVIYELSPSLYSLFSSTFLKKAALILLLYVGLALVSEGIGKVLNTRTLRDKVWNALEAKLKA